MLCFSFAVAASPNGMVGANLTWVRNPNDLGVNSQMEQTAMNLQVNMNPFRTVEVVKAGRTNCCVVEWAHMTIHVILT